MAKEEIRVTAFPFIEQMNEWFLLDAAVLMHMYFYVAENMRRIEIFIQFGK